LPYDGLHLASICLPHNNRWEGNVMREIRGDIWKEGKERNAFVIIPTNATIKTSGQIVMGRGLAKQASTRYPKLAKELGDRIKVHGNTINMFIHRNIITFPVKHNWWEDADLALIRTSADCLMDLALLGNKRTFLVPRVGCGNGRLKWKDVKPVLEKAFDGTNNIIICDVKK